MGTPTGARFLPFSIPAAWSWSQTYHDLPAGSLVTPSGAQFAATEVTHGCSDQVAAAISAQHLQSQGVFVAGAGSTPNVLGHARANDPGDVTTLTS